jgi:hypothetical protein
VLFLDQSRKRFPPLVPHGGLWHRAKARRLTERRPRRAIRRSVGRIAAFPSTTRRATTWISRPTNLEGRSCRLTALGAQPVSRVAGRLHNAARQARPPDCVWFLCTAYPRRFTRSAANLAVNPETATVDGRDVRGLRRLCHSRRKKWRRSTHPEPSFSRRRHQHAADGLARQPDSRGPRAPEWQHPTAPEPERGPPIQYPIHSVTATGDRFVVHTAAAGLHPTSSTA